MAEAAALKREAKRVNAPAPVFCRRGPSRRARPSSAVAAQAAESEVAGAEVEQSEEVVEDLQRCQRAAAMDDVPALGVGRRGASRRARVASSVAVMAGKVVAEEKEQRAQIPHGRCVRAKGTSSEPIRLDDSDDDEMEDAKPEEQQEDAQILGVGRRGRASRHAPAHLEAPATRRSTAASKADAGDVALEAVPIRSTRQRNPTMKAAATAAAADEKAPRRGTRQGTVRSTLLQQEVEEEPQEAVGAPDIAAEAVPIRATRKRKPTMKAAAAEVKTPPRATRRSEVMRTVLQPEAQEEPQEAVGAPVSYHRCDALEELEEVSDPQKEELNEVDAQEQDEDQNVVIIENEELMEDIPAEEPPVTDQAQKESQQAVDAPVSHQPCDALQELEEDFDPQKEELNKVDTTEHDEDQDLGIIEDEKLIEDTPAEEPPVIDQAQEEPQGVFCDTEAVGAPISYQPCDALEELEEDFDPQNDELNKVDAPEQDEDQDLVIIEDEKLMKETSVAGQKCTQKSEIQEQLVDDEKCDAPLAIHEESPILGLVSMVAEHASEDDEEVVDAPVSHKRCDALEELAEPSDSHDLVINEAEKLMEETPAEEPCVTDQECTDKSEMQEHLVDNEKCHSPLANHEESPILGLVSTVTEQASEDDEGVLSDVEVMDAPVSPQRCDALDELAEATDPQKEELKVDTLKQDEEQDVIIIEDEKLMEEIIAEEPSVTHQEWTDNSEMQEQQMDNEKCHEESTVTEQVSQDDVGASFQNGGGSSSDLLDKGLCEETYDAGEEMELVPGVQTLQAPLTGNESDASDANLESEMGDFNEVLTFREEIIEDDTQVSKEKEHMDITESLSTVGVETNEEVVTKNGLGCQEEGDVGLGRQEEGYVVVHKALHDWVDNTIIHDSSGDISWVEMEKAGNVTSEMPENQAALDVDGDEDKGHELTGSNVENAGDNNSVEMPENQAALDVDGDEDIELELTGSNVDNVGDKNSVEPIAVLEEKGVKAASECEDLTKLSMRQLKAKLKEKLNAKKNKEANKRVALGRVDENVCRSHAKGQQQDLNLRLKCASR